MTELDEESACEGDPDDPFDGTASGIFWRLHRDPAHLFLPPPVHTPKQQQENSSKQIEHLTHSSNLQQNPVNPTGLQEITTEDWQRQ